MSRIFVLDHPIFFSGSDGIVVHPTTAINNSANITASIVTEQDISTTGSVTFNESNFSGSINVANGKWIIQKAGDAVTITPSGSFNVTGSLGVSQNFSGLGNFIVNGNLNAKQFNTQFTSASVIFPSGSTKFGDTTDDLHPFTGSISIGTQTTMSITIPTGSGGPVTYNITEFRNERFPSPPLDQVNPVTEYAGRSLIAPFSANQVYIRKCFAKKATSITSTTATFNAETASAPRSDDTTLFEQLPATSENDFIFFRNGMMMEQDALSIQQNNSELVLTINVGGIGYELDSGDEIIAWGKFNS